MVTETTVPYKPWGGDKFEKYLVKLAFRHLAVCTVCLPLGAFVTCVFWSLYFNFERSTSTHCHVSNYLPSISAAIGGTDAQSFIWNISIAMHCGPRFFVAKMYNNFYNKFLVPSPQNFILAKINAFLSVMENLALLGLSFVSSRDNYPIHEKFFITFMICSELYMLLTLHLMGSLRDSFVTSRILHSLNMKRHLVTVNMIAFALAAFFFYRHNWYCETGIYTLFALSEYVVVFTNMAYHMTAYYDFYDKFVYAGPSFFIKTS